MSIRIRRFSFLLFLGLAGCASHPATATRGGDDIVTREFPRARAEITAQLDRIAEALRVGDAQQLRSVHLDGPKFTKFGRAPGRQGFEDALVDEVAALVDGASNVDVEHRDLRIDVFGEVAVCTSFPHISLTTPEGVDVEVDLRATGVWVKTKDGWKLAHEHNSLATPD